MKMVCTSRSDGSVDQINIYGGPSLNAVTTEIPNSTLQNLPIQATGSTLTTVKAYVAMKKDLKNIGYTQSVVTTTQYPTDYGSFLYG